MSHNSNSKSNSNSKPSSLSSLLKYSDRLLPPDQDLAPAPHDLESASSSSTTDCATPIRSICSAPLPSIFKILSLGIVFLGITAVVAGVLSGDWEASLCVIAMLVLLETWIWLEDVKIQEMKRSRCGYRGWRLGDGMNRVLFTWAGVGGDGALLG